MYVLFLCLRYLRKRRIAFFAVAAVSLCVAMVLIVVSVMGGFLQMVKDRSRGMLGDLIMENGTLQGFPFYDEFIQQLNTDPQIGPHLEEATPVIITYGVIRFPHDLATNAIQIVGIKLDETYRVNDFKKGLFYEKYYPGTTTLAPQKEPVVGLDENNVPRLLPPDLEAAWQKWKASSTPKELAEAPIDEDLAYQRPGYYRPLSRSEWLESADPRWVGDERPGAILGADLCAKRTSDGSYQRYYWRGDKVQITLVPLSDLGSLEDTSPQHMICRYADDSRTGIFDIDSMSVYVDFTRLQSILRMDDSKLDDGGDLYARTTQVQIKLRSGVDPERIQKLIRERWEQFYPIKIPLVRTPKLLERVEVNTWEQKQARFIAAVEKEKILVTTLFGVISVVAVFLIGVIFYMIVQQKTRDIGIIKSVGATSWGVARIFLAYGAAVGIVGGAIGLLLGYYFVIYINEIQELLAEAGKLFGWNLRIWDAAVYTFDRIPSHVSGRDVVVIYLVAIIASMVGALMAAVRAARIWPVEALRYE